MQVKYLILHQDSSLSPSLAVMGSEHEGAVDPLSIQHFQHLQRFWGFYESTYIYKLIVYSFYSRVSEKLETPESRATYPGFGVYYLQRALYCCCVVFLRIFPLVPTLFRHLSFFWFILYSVNPLFSLQW